MASFTLFVVACLCVLSPTSSFAPAIHVAGRAEMQLFADVASNEVATDPKEAVKVFGRLAEKYIMLDSSGGMCCYSACSGT